MMQWMCAYHSGKRVLLVFFLQEDECVCEKERQDVCGGEDKKENIVNNSFI